MLAKAEIAVTEARKGYAGYLNAGDQEKPGKKLIAHAIPPGAAGRRIRTGIVRENTFAAVSDSVTEDLLHLPRSGKTLRLPDRLQLPLSDVGRLLADCAVAGNTSPASGSVPQWALPRNTSMAQQIAGVGAFLRGVNKRSGCPQPPPK